MKKNAIVFALWQRNIGVLQEFMKYNFNCVILTSSQCVPHHTRKVIVSNGCKIIYFSELLSKQQQIDLSLESSGLLTRLECEIEQEKLTNNNARIKRCTDIANMVIKDLAGLNNAQDKYNINFSIVNEQYTPLAKAMVLFFNKINIPVIYLSHGASWGKRFTVHDVSYADIYLLAGERFNNSYDFLEKNHKKGSIITGFPCWDAIYNTIKTPEYVINWQKAYKLERKLPTVTFFTTWVNFLSELHHVQKDIGIRTLRLMLFAKKQLEGIIDFNLIIKDRGGVNHKVHTEQLIKEFNLNSRLILHTSDEPCSFLNYSDLIISIDSTISVEAIVAANAPLNIPSDMAWYYGPFIGGNDGIINLTEENIVETITTFLTQPEKRQQYIDDLRNNPQYYSPAFEGKATEAVCNVMNEFMPLTNSEQIKQYQLKHQHDAEVFEHLNTGIEQPVIHFVVKMTADQQDLLVITLTSLFAQLNSNWQLLVVADFAVPDVIFEQHDFLHWIYMQPEHFSETGLDDVVKCLDTGWVGLLQVGMRLEPYFVTQCHRYINAHPEWQYIYMDEAKTNQFGDICTVQTRACLTDNSLDEVFNVGDNCLIKADVLQTIITEQPTADVAESYDWLLKVYSRFGADVIGHIPHLLVTSSNLLFEAKMKEVRSEELLASFLSADDIN